MGGFDLSLCVVAFFVGVLPVVVNIYAPNISAFYSLPFILLLFFIYSLFNIYEKISKKKYF